MRYSVQSKDPIFVKGLEFFKEIWVKILVNI